MTDHDAEKEALRRTFRNLAGLYVGQLDETERDMFYRACELGVAAHDYDHSAGVLGLAKVKLR